MLDKVLYRHIRLDTNEVFYIGIGSEKRAYESGKYQRNSWWKRIVNKTDYRVDILFDDLTWEEACEKEFIALYGRRDLGTGTLVNLTDGGEGTLGVKRHPLSPETKKKISEANLGNTHTEETKLKMSKTRKGRTKSKEWIKKISESNKGICKPHTQETKDKISKSMIGRFVSEETKRKISESCKRTKAKN